MASLQSRPGWSDEKCVEDDRPDEPSDHHDHQHETLASFGHGDGGHHERQDQRKPHQRDDQWQLDIEIAKLADQLW